MVRHDSSLHQKLTRRLAQFEISVPNDAPLIQTGAAKQQRQCGAWSWLLDAPSVGSVWGLTRLLTCADWTLVDNGFGDTAIVPCRSCAEQWGQLFPPFSESAPEESAVVVALRASTTAGPGQVESRYPLADDEVLKVTTRYVGPKNRGSYVSFAWRVTVRGPVELAWSSARVRLLSAAAERGDPETMAALHADALSRLEQILSADRERPPLLQDLGRE